MFAYEMLGKRVTIHSEPSVAGEWMGWIDPFAKVEYDAIVPDHQYPGDGRYQWLQLTGGGFCNYVYPPNGLRFELHRRFGVVLHDHELWGVSRPEHNGAPRRIRSLPEVITLQNNRRIYMTPEIQNYWFDKLKLSAPTMPEKELKKAWRSLTRSDRAFTNFGGSDRCADYINGTLLDREPMRFEPIVCGGAYLRILGDPFWSWGHWLYRIAAINVNLPLPDINQFTAPDLFFNGTISVRERGQTCLRKVEPFWQLDGADVPVPIFSSASTNAIRMERIRLLAENDPVPSPYCK